MKGNIYILDGNLAKVMLVEGISSLIWAKRYDEPGDCEIYLPATAELLDNVQRGMYIMRTDDDMICRIDRIELTSDADSGDWLTITGRDVSVMLDQRVVWNTTSGNNVRAETFIRTLVNDALITAGADRTVYKANGNALLSLGTDGGLTGVVSTQVTFANLGTKVREICKQFGFGYRITGANGALVFDVYKGADRSGSVVFADNFDNFMSQEYADDGTDLANVALVAGSGEGPLRERATAGTETGTSRWEIYVDERNTSNETTYGDVKAKYPLQGDGGHGFIWTNPYTDISYYRMSTFDIQILDDAQKSYCETAYPGGVYLCTLDGGCVYRAPNVDIARLASMTPLDDSIAYWIYPVYAPQLINAGLAALADHGAVVTFEGEITDSPAYVYGTDYTLGDVVTIRSRFGITAAVRITEVDMIDDDTGSRTVTKFELV